MESSNCWVCFLELPLLFYSSSSWYRMFVAPYRNRSDSCSRTVHCVVPHPYAIGVLSSVRAGPDSRHATKIKGVA